MKSQKIKNILKDVKIYKGSNKWLILDGQQRIQSLYLSLMGSRDNKEMYLDFTNSQEKTFVRDGSFSLYKFKFINKGNKKPIGYIKLKDLYKAFRNIKEISISQKIKDGLYRKIHNWKDLIEDAKQNDYEDKVYEILAQFHISFIKEEIFCEVIKDEDSDEEVFNIFTRINNGGIKLSYADIIFIYFKTFWHEAQEHFAELLQKIPNGFSISYDFLVKTCVTLLKNNCEFDFSIIDKQFVNELKMNWKQFSNAVITAFESLNKIFIYDNSTLRSNISVIPIIYAIFHNKIRIGLDTEYFKNELKKYIYVSHLKDVFGSKPETIVNKIVNNYLKDNRFDAEKILELIIGSNYKIVKNDIDSVIGYRNTKLILNLIYFQNTNFLAMKNSTSYKLDIDHIFPESDCKNYFEKSEKNRYNNVLNYCYLSIEKNRKIKLRTPPDRFFRNKKDLQKHLVPNNSLFGYDVQDRDDEFVKNFEYFKKKRLTLIVRKINEELNFKKNRGR